MNQKYDAMVIGAGQAGPSLAARFAGAGKSVAIIERHLIGGTCVNSGCTPTKTLIASARIAYDARRAHCFVALVRHSVFAYLCARVGTLVFIFGSISYAILADVNSAHDWGSTIAKILFFALPY